MTSTNHKTINKVQKVWNVKPQVMLDYVLKTDELNGLHKEPDYCPTFYVGKSLKYIQEIYQNYNGIDSLTESEQLQNGYYKLIIETS